MQRLAILAHVVTVAFALVSNAAQGQKDLAPDSTAMRVKRTTRWAAIVPGSGQMINQQSWKVPLVWGGMGYAAWSTWDSAQEMKSSIDDLVALTDDDPATQPVLKDAFGNFYSEYDLEQRALFYRRNRDLSILSFLVAHGLQVLDANTSAMLRNLDTSDALSTRLESTFGVPCVHLTWRFSRSPNAPLP